jgi:hypothetical protein
VHALIGRVAASRAVATSAAAEGAAAARSEHRLRAPQPAHRRLPSAIQVVAVGVDGAQVELELGAAPAANRALAVHGRVGGAPRRAHHAAPLAGGGGRGGGRVGLMQGEHLLLLHLQVELLVVVVHRVLRHGHLRDVVHVVRVAHRVLALLPPHRLGRLQRLVRNPQQLA